jgi:hypothetical protein
MKGRTTTIRCDTYASFLRLNFEHMPRPQPYEAPSQSGTPDEQHIEVPETTAEEPLYDIPLEPEPDYFDVCYHLLMPSAGSDTPL